MVRSMVAAVAGLKSHQSKMDVIGNNIANVNTWGFKSFSYNFKDSMYANSINSTGGSVAAGAAGGRNASQVGYGSGLSSITNEFGTGSPSPSSNPLDCMIDGTGFFLVGNMINGSVTDVAGSGLYLSRVGIFRVDNNGYLVDDQRSYVYGYALQEDTGIPEKPATRAVYDITGATATVTQNANGGYTFEIGGRAVDVSATASEADAMQAWILKYGGKQITKVDANGDPEIGADGKPVKEDTEYTPYTIGYVDHDGTLAGAAAGGGTLTFNLTVTAKAAGTDSFANPLGGTMETRTAGAERVAGVAAKYENELSAIRIPTDPDTGMQYEIQSYKINEDGTIIGVDTQNRTIAIGQLALVTVENPNGLEKTDGYYYSVGANAGDAVAIKPNGGPAGKIMGGYLEMANVDLANEFSNMITCQRGFQANSKMITVTDEMLSELVNMKR